MRYKPNFSDAPEFSIMSKGCRETRHPLNANPICYWGKKQPSVSTFQY